jgi:hypothetical protein
MQENRNAVQKNTNAVWENTGSIFLSQGLGLFFGVVWGKDAESCRVHAGFSSKCATSNILEYRWLSVPGAGLQSFRGKPRMDEGDRHRTIKERAISCVRKRTMSMLFNKHISCRS